MTDLRIVNARIFVDGIFFEGGLSIDGGKIVEIRKESMLMDSDETIDANGNLVIPGLVDLHVHFREPGFTHKEDFMTGTRAAAAGGVTTVVDEPNNKPITDSIETLEAKRDLVAPKGYVDYSFSVNVNSSNIMDIPAMREWGVLCYAFFHELGGKPTGVQDTGMLREALREIKKVDGLGLLNCRDNYLIDYTMKKLEGEGKTSIDDYNSSFPHVAESIGAAKRILLAQETGVRTHLREVSTASTLDLLRKLKPANISAEVRPDHLFLNHEDSKNLGPYAQQWTPLRGSKDNAALLEALNEGIVDVIASDHATHAAYEKEKGVDNIWRSPPGLPAIETMLPLLLTEVNKGNLSIATLVRAACEKPARVLGLYPRKGAIKVGSDADLVIIDMVQEQVVREEDSLATNKWTPFEGMVVKGVPVMTFVRGVLTFNHGEIVGEHGQGEWLRL